jgi:hypothetical protein
MAQTGYTPILIYSSSTVSQAPAAGSLTNSTLGSELAINITDGKLFYKDNANAVQVIAWKTTPTTAGGTGLTSYTAGDLLYYATGTTLTKLAIGASGRWLGSSGTAPQWNAPAALTKTDDTNVTLTLGGSASTALLNAASLTLGWTGTLAVSRGGTGTGTAFTAGSVIFAGASGVYSQDNANFFWDDSNNRLGIGSNAPKAPLDVKLAAGRWMTTKYDTNITLSAENDSGNPENMRIYGENIRLYTPQGGFAAANLTLGAELFSTSGDFKLYTGNLIQGTAAKGINFTANTPAAGMTSQLLNWYEEGTWTPALAFGGASTGITYNAQAGTYTRIGRLVHCFARLSLSSKGSAAGSATITGLPFTSASGDASNGGVMTPSLYSNMASLTGLSGYVGASSTTINLGNDGATDTNGINATNFTNSTTIYFSVQYYV